MVTTETMPTFETAADQESHWERLAASAQDIYSSIQKHLPEKFSGSEIIQKASEMMRNLNETITANKLVKAGALAGALVLATSSVAQAGETLDGVLGAVDRAQQEQSAPPVNLSELPDNVRETLVNIDTSETPASTDIKQMPDETENYNNKNQPGHRKDGDTTKIGSIVVE